MIDCAAKVKEQLEKGDVGANRTCEYYPCHYDGQNCSLCFCPFYPCLDQELGKFVPSKKGGEVWSCEECYWSHRPDVVRSFFEAVAEDKGVRSHEEYLRLKDVLQRRHLRRARTLMVLGATSGAGKSLLTTAFCRYFSDQGWSVSPFKGQNMSLNSMVTDGGAEIARAQELQARGARAVPTAHMNPILLKPLKDDRSQVVVEGKPYRDMGVREYYDEFAQTEGVSIIRENIDLLRRINDVVVIEGAGSPAEINMMDKDITNMRTAELAEATCVLVVNIEWGGAFAYAYGTLMLLPEGQRRMFKGTIITNLHGERESLRPGEDFLKRTTGIPVIGILPHLELDLPDEDSMFIGARRSRKKGVKVGVVRLPRISNFTDFDALSLSEAEVIYIDRPEQVEAVDALIIPGTKNTVADLLWMRERGMDKAIIAIDGKVPILGICGGYQMLGEVIDDRKGIEGGVPRTYAGLGLLPVSTTFDEYEKRTVQVRGNIIGDEAASVRGYEIHMGLTERKAGQAIFRLIDDGQQHEEGTRSDDGMVMGTYLHGVFDLPAFRREFLGRAKHIRSENGTVEDYDHVVERNLEMLGKALEENIDLPLLIRAMGLPEERR